MSGVTAVVSAEANAEHSRARRTSSVACAHMQPGTPVPSSCTHTEGHYQWRWRQTAAEWRQQLQCPSNCSCAVGLTLGIVQRSPGSRLNPQAKHGVASSNWEALRHCMTTLSLAAPTSQMLEI